MTKEIDFEKIGKPLMTPEQYVKFLEALNEERNPELIEERVKNETSNQIFAELDKIAWQQIEPEKLEKFYNEFSKAKDNVSALAIVQKFSIIGFSAKKYDNVKKKWEYK